MMSFVDVEIHVQKRESAQGFPGDPELAIGQHYQIEIRVEELGSFHSGYFKIDDKTDAERTLLMNPHLADQAYGQQLFRWFFSDATLSRHWTKIRNEHSHRRIRLFLDENAPELHVWPWEALCEPPADGQPAHQIAADPNTPFSRFLPSDAALIKPLSHRPLRMLVVAPKQANFDEQFKRDQKVYRIDPEGELDALKEKLKPLIAQGQLEEPELLRAPCSLANIVSALSEARAANKGYHILHLITHGYYGEGGASLLLANQDNQVFPEVDQDIAAQLSPFVCDDENGLRLIFLASCDSAKRSPANAFHGLAPKLVIAGVPAVIAMQGWIDKTMVSEFAAKFYEQLLRHGQVDQATNEARQVVMAARRFSSVIPVLFLRLKDGKLMEPDPDLAILRNALAQMLAGDTYADVADSSKRYLRLPVEVLSISKDQPLWEALRVHSDPTAGIRFEDATIDKINSVQMILVVGDYGSNITTQLKRFAWVMMQRVLVRMRGMVEEDAKLAEPDQNARFLPFFATLGELRHGKATYPADPVVGLVLYKLNDDKRSPTVGSGLTVDWLKNVLKKFKLTLLLILDDDDKLAEREQRDYYTLITNRQSGVVLGDKDPLKVVLAVRPEALKLKGFFSEQRFDVLAVQPIERRKVRHFLRMEAKEKLWAEKLLEQIDQSVYYDLVAIPWFLVKVVEQAKNGFCPGSRSEVIATIIDNAIDGVVQDIAEREQDHYPLRPSLQGLEDNIRQIIYDLAWQMQFSYADSLPLAETLALIERDRGYRSYSVERMYEALVTGSLLARKGSDRVRFAYQSIQSYCCAQAILQQPNSEQMLDDIMANLGRLSRLRWWEPTLVCTSGLMTSAPTLLKKLLQIIVYGMDPLNNEQLFLAARCVTESIQAYRVIQQRENGKQELLDDLDKMANVIARALRWRLDSRREPRSAERRQAAELLGQIAYPPTTERVSELVRVAYGKSRWDRHNKPSFDHSDVRMAAVVGLLRLPAKKCTDSPSSIDRKGILSSIDRKGVLTAMLEQWTNGNVQELVATLSSKTNIAAQSIAALALGDLWGRLSLSTDSEENEKARKARKALITKFQEATTHEDTMWAVAYALAMIDLPTVKQAIVEDGLGTGLSQEESAASQSDAFFRQWRRRGEKRKFLAYFIGLARWRDPQPLAFLYTQCLKKNSSHVTLAAVAIEALSRVGNPKQDVKLLEKIAVGNWANVLGLKEISDADHEYLQRKAIDTLAILGDLACVDRLRQCSRSAAWSPELERALFIASEKIFWRTAENHEP